MQEANEAYDKGINPKMLVEEKFDRIAFRDIVNAVFATSSRDEANAVIEEFSRFWMSIIGTRGATGKKNCKCFYTIWKLIHGGIIWQK